MVWQVDVYAKIINSGPKTCKVLVDSPTAMRAGEKALDFVKTVFDNAEEPMVMTIAPTMFDGMVLD